MSKPTANKNPNNMEIGEPLGGYFAKEYQKCFQIFGPDREFYLKIYKTSNEDCEFKVCNLLVLLNEQRQSKVGGYGTTISPEEDKQANIGHLRMVCQGMDSELRERRIEMAEHARKISYRNQEIQFLRKTLENLTSALNK